MVRLDRQETGRIRCSRQSCGGLQRLWKARRREVASGFREGWCYLARAAYAQRPTAADGSGDAGSAWRCLELAQEAAKTRLLPCAASCKCPWNQQSRAKWARTRRLVYGESPGDSGESSIVEADWMHIAVTAAGPVNTAMHNRRSHRRRRYRVARHDGLAVVPSPLDCVVQSRLMCPRRWMQMSTSVPCAAPLDLR